MVTPTHRSTKIKSYLSNGAAKRLHLECFPGYAPELNQSELVRSCPKVGDLANISSDTLPDFTNLPHQAKRRLHHRPDLVKSFIQNVNYHFSYLQRSVIEKRFPK
jgi:hypothetical protein